MTHNKLLAASISAVSLVGHDASLAAEFPQRPVRFIVPYTPGGDATIGVDLAAQAPADGHTLAMIITSHAVHPSIRKLPYDLARDLAPVINVLEGPAILVVNPGLKVNSVRELISLAKARDGKLNFGAPGIGGPGHLSGIMFNYLADVRTTHVPYKGGAAVIVGLLSGEVDLMFATILSGMPHVKSGKLKALAVTSAERSAIVPELPTMIEAGLKGFESVTWYGVVTRARTPGPVLEKIAADILAVVKSPEATQILTSQGVQIVGMGPREFAAHLQSEIKKWATIVKQANLQDLQDK